MSENYCINDMNPGQSARIRKVVSSDSIRRRFLDLGLTEHTLIQCVGKSPSGDPAAYLIRGAVIAIRQKDGKGIFIDGPASRDKLIAVAGNPNVGKSTLFNNLTGMKQHTGNWPGKTVANAFGSFQTPLHSYILADIPGTYSLMAHSPEEEAARDFLCFGGIDGALVVCDATCLERNLNLVLQTLELVPRVLVCVNLMDEAAHRNIQVDLIRLSRILGVPVIGTTARKKHSLFELSEALDQLMDAPCTSPLRPVTYPAEIEAALQLLEPAVQREAGGRLPARWLALRLLEEDPVLEEKTTHFLGKSLRELPSVDSALSEAKAILRAAGISRTVLEDRITASLIHQAEEIARLSVKSDSIEACSLDRKLDRLFTSRFTGCLTMVLLLVFVFWLTITGANYPSRLLSAALFRLQDLLTELFLWLHAPDWLHGILVLGAYRVLAWVVSVMLPPMAIFFPLFTLLEDSGYLPRIAFNLDHTFQRCHSCGKQALTLCMGFGCNAVGVTGCRIIDSQRERLIAILTNNLVPCNGRFPTLITLISLFFAGTLAGCSSGILSALLLTGVVLLGIGMTFAASWFLSRTFLKGVPSSFTLELPPYRRPQFGKVLLHSLLDRTLTVLGRAVRSAAPAGALIWLLANLRIEGTSLLTGLSAFLDPFARLFGLDGAILMAFVLGLPANEIVLPVILMAYLEQGALTDYSSLTFLKELLLSHGWTWVTAACMGIFCLFHWPCATTLLTIRKETGSRKWTLLAAVLPTAIGLSLCFLTAQAARLLGI